MSVDPNFAKHFMRRAVLYAMAQEKVDMEHKKLRIQLEKEEAFQWNVWWIDRLNHFKDFTNTLITFTQCLYAIVLFPFVFPIIFLCILFVPFYVSSALQTSSEFTSAWNWTLARMVKIMCSFDQISNGWNPSYPLRFWKWLIFILIDQCPTFQTLHNQQ